MKIVIVAEKQSIFDKCGSMFQQKLEQGAKREVVYLLREKGNRKNFIDELKALEPDILITVDLLGFEQCTLTDSIAYNLLNCKQIHLLLRGGLENEKYLQKQLSISMFFYCVGETYLEYLKSIAPNIPYIKEIAGWRPAMNEESAETNADAVCSVLDEVLAECRLY